LRNSSSIWILRQVVLNQFIISREDGDNLLWICIGGKGTDSWYKIADEVNILVPPPKALKLFDVSRQTEASEHKKRGSVPQLSNLARIVKAEWVMRCETSATYNVRQSVTVAVGANKKNIAFLKKVFFAHYSFRIDLIKVIKFGEAVVLKILYIDDLDTLAEVSFGII